METAYSSEEKTVDEGMNGYPQPIAAIASTSMGSPQSEPDVAEEPQLQNNVPSNEVEMERRE